ncbi:hypothetical protein [Falsihalocynthiibacter arcticus]|uniref:hypothetical protein n=1 Tax=Falsihalocynthiibacter arcticus TaxID=1579316 RepID=UPI001F43CD9A|nr:hypothetical protein [Falsihalocynthiibacter arcticus]
MVKVLIPSGALGLNYDKAALARGLAQNPDIIAIDGGSTDSGPAYLGQGVSKYARSSIKIEWKGLMVARQEANVPLVIGTAGTCGTDSAVNWLLDITKEIAAELGQTLQIAVLRSSQDAEILATAFDSGRVTPSPRPPKLPAKVLRNVAISWPSLVPNKLPPRSKRARTSSSRGAPRILRPSPPSR